MRYFVVTASSRYGPADLAQLQQWAREGRIAQHSELEEVSTGRRLQASDLPGLSFAVFQQAPATGPAAPLSQTPASSSGPQQPLPPNLVSNYRRPGWEPPLFLHDPEKGKRELMLAFVFALAAPLIALIHIYGLGMAIGSIYCSIVAIRSGRSMGILALILGIASVPAAFLARFWLEFVRW